MSEKTYPRFFAPMMQPVTMAGDQPLIVLDPLRQHVLIAVESGKVFFAKSSHTLIASTKDNERVIDKLIEKNEFTEITKEELPEWFIQLMNNKANLDKLGLTGPF